ncbi:hypothetical protein DFH07DRAFT_952092 [Mycena maculata]|uniref:RNase H type-1 domain-containing protein n=1 Tax=Mycena maculata TaxID=230809 RepID=A0AAD7NUX0_9AGAR|nr:hypothetical protein DFH07DRAFT_952092 [Mycena maculata]
MWTPCFLWAIANDKDEACKAAESVRSDGVVVYSDGSGYNGSIGVAVVAMVNGQLASWRFFLGSIEDHTVLEGELTGMVPTLDIAWRTPCIHSFTILLDNQSSI